MERLTIKNWRNLDPWETCGQDNYCNRGCHDYGKTWLAYRQKPEED